MNPPRHRCPACQEEVVSIATQSGKLCPKCGADAWTWAAEPPPSPDDALPTNWLVLLAIILAPAVLTTLGVLVGSGEGIMVLVLYGSGVAALIGALWVALRIKLHLAIRIGLAILLTPVFYFACVALSFAGCALSARGF